jgi:hypothetical protein
MAEIFLTPKDEGGAVELSQTLFRKKILPTGTIDYKGRKITFDKAYLTDLATAYKANAYDQVPFMLADASNAHTMDPERFRGEVQGVEVAEDGLWATLSLSAEAAKLVRENPKLGVSARIVEGYDRSDGKKFPRAMQHVLGTLDPRLPGLGAWTEVALSGYDSDSEVLDMTASEFEGDTTVPKTDDADLIDGLTREEYEALLASLELEDETDDTDEGAVEPEPQKVVAQLSNEDRTSLDLANTEILALKAQNATTRFDADKRDYVQRGVPPALVELAREVLTAPDGAVLDFSNGTETVKVDAAHVVRQLLDSAAGYIKLAQERGHSVDFSNETKTGDDDPDKAALEMWANMDKQS